MKTKKLYKTLNDVPHGKWNLIVIALKYGKYDVANRLAHSILIQIKDIPVFEVFMLKRKLREKAGLKNN